VCVCIFVVVFGCVCSYTCIQVPGAHAQPKFIVKEAISYAVLKEAISNAVQKTEESLQNPSIPSGLVLQLARHYVESWPIINPSALAPHAAHRRR